MSIDTKQLSKIAKLAHLTFSEKDASHITADLNTILSLVEKMDKIDTQSVSPLCHPLEISKSLRKDEVTEAPKTEALESLTSHTENHCYLVPKVIESS